MCYRYTNPLSENSIIITIILEKSRIILENSKKIVSRGMAPGDTCYYAELSRKKMIPRSARSRIAAAIMATNIDFLIGRR